jgi:hypothetical protein
MASNEAARKLCKKIDARQFAPRRVTVSQAVASAELAGGLVQLSRAGVRGEDTLAKVGQMLKVLDDVLGARPAGSRGLSDAMSPLLQTAYLDSSSGDNNIRRALKSAKDVRNLIEKARRNTRDHVVLAGAPTLKR